MHRPATIHWLPGHPFMLTLQSSSADPSQLQEPPAPDRSSSDGIFDPPRGEDAVLNKIAEDLGVQDESTRAALFASHYLLPLFEPPTDMELPVDLRVRDLLPADFCRRNRMVPLTADDQTVEVAIATPDALPKADEVKRLCGRQMRPLFARGRIIDRACELLFGEAAGPPKTAATKDGAPRQAAGQWRRLGLDAKAAADCQREIIRDSGLVICSGPRAVDKRPVARTWARIARQTHQCPVVVWQGRSPDRETLKPAAKIFRDLNDRRAAEACVHQVLEGERVFAVLHARDVSAIILRMRAWDRIGDILCELISLIVHVDPDASPGIRVTPVDAPLRKALAEQPRGASLDQLFPSTGDSACGP